jgi:hypothetical protein
MRGGSTTPDLADSVRVILEAADRADFAAILSFYAAGLAE